MFEDLFQMITRVAVPKQLYLFLYPSKGWKCYMSNLYQCFYVYFQMLDIFTFYVFVVLPKFLLLAVHCRYRLCLCMRLDSVIAGRLNSDELLFRITQASLLFSYA